MSGLTSISEKTISVSEVAATVKACFDSPLFCGLEVFGEVSGFKVTGGHAYFTLKDKNAQMSAVCFNVARTYVPRDGESVILRCRVDYYAKGGRLSLLATSITPAGQGLLFLEFEKLKAKLNAEGLFAPEHKKPIPKYCGEVLVITSKTGAVIRDINTTIRRKNPVINITVKDVRVQGEGAAKEICAALKRADALFYDVIIIARGGGSLEDLAPFYDEQLVRTIYDMNTPVVSAVGHETDYSLCDFVADARAATPTAAAELVAYDYYGLLDDVMAMSNRIKSLISVQLNKKLMRAKLATSQLGKSAAEVLAARSSKVIRLSERMKGAIGRRYDSCAAKALSDVSALRVAADRKVVAAEYKVNGAINALDNLNPLKVLKRGYFKVETPSGAADVASLSKGDEITAYGHDGKFVAQVKDITLFKEDI